MILGLRPLVVDRATEVGSSWRGRYDRLRLNTSRALSHLPDRRFPKGTPMFPTRDQLVDHLERHASEGDSSCSWAPTWRVSIPTTDHGR